MRIRFRSFAPLLLLLILAAVLAAAGSAWLWAMRPMVLPADKVEFTVEPGASPRAVAHAMREAGVPIWEDGFMLLARFSKRDKLIQAGGYEAKQGDSPWLLLGRLARGERAEKQITFIEGWTFKQMREALRKHPNVRQTLDDVDDAALMARLGAPGKSPEGLFFPDTYTFPSGSADFDILRRAYTAEQQVLADAWGKRAPNLPYTDAYDALIMASLIEKETGYAGERARIAGVFVNRLKKGMPLQTDPSVIYGMGDAYAGKIHKADLQADTPWNTYTRTGLPPTPIAMTGRAALAAALHPEAHNYLYFVSRGDGSSEFSATLNDHNKNVARFILTPNSSPNLNPNDGAKE